MRFVIAATLAFAANAAAAETKEIKADVWVDNWFEVYANGELVMEDPVSITTERSFNAGIETFEVELPAVIGIFAKDFKENDSGLEYIGTGRQQMGDGGLIAQFHDAATGQMVGATDAQTKCLVVNHAPVDTACADLDAPVAGEGACGFENTQIPENWTAVDFDDSDWPVATVHSEQEVSPKGGYDEITWKDEAALIWGESLKQDNTLLCRVVLGH